MLEDEKICWNLCLAGVWLFVMLARVLSRSRTTLGLLPLQLITAGVNGANELA